MTNARRKGREWENSETRRIKAVRNKAGVSREFLKEVRNRHRAFSLRFLISKKRTPSVVTEFLNNEETETERFQISGFL